MEWSLFIKKPASIAKAKACFCPARGHQKDSADGILPMPRSVSSTLKAATKLRDSPLTSISLISQLAYQSIQIALRLGPLAQHSVTWDLDLTRSTTSLHALSCI